MPTVNNVIRLAGEPDFLITAIHFFNIDIFAFLNMLFNDRLNKANITMPPKQSRNFNKIKQK